MAFPHHPAKRASAAIDASPMLTIARVAEQLDVSERTVRRWIDAKHAAGAPHGPHDPHFAW